MKNTITILIISSIISFSCCKSKTPAITKTNELSANINSYFVNYEVGTKWIYQDTMDSNNLDTIELITKVPMDVNNGSGTISKGYELYYKPKKSKDFKVFVNAGDNNIYYIKIDPMIAAASAITFENENGTWKSGINYYDSIEITGNKYFNVIHSQSSSTYHSRFYISKYKGIIFFWRMNGNGILATYKLINTIKP
jgi:hypothetical protein